MTNIVRNTLVACGFAGFLTTATAAPTLAQIVVIGPHPYRGYYGYYHDFPAGYDTGGAPFSYRDLGWQPGYPGGAPANPCTIGRRQQNRC